MIPFECDIIIDADDKNPYMAYVSCVKHEWNWQGTVPTAPTKEMPEILKAILKHQGNRIARIRYADDIERAKTT